MVHPRAEDTHAAQFAAVLVRNHVVRIVRARAFVLESLERRPGKRFAQPHPIGPVRIAVRAIELLLDVRLFHGAPGSIGQADGRAVADDEVLPANGGEMQLSHVVAHPVE